MLSITLTNNDNIIVLFYWQFHRFAIVLSHISNLALIDAVAEISTALCTHQMFGQNTLATVDAHIAVDL